MMDTTDTYDVLRRAILNREPVTAVYDGEVRAFCPHALGSKQGRRHVLGYQYGGKSKSGLPRRGEWRCFDVDRLGDVTARPGQWHSSANAFNPQSCMDTLDVVVQPLPPRTSVSR
jgi:hypothetical protein